MARFAKAQAVAATGLVSTKAGKGVKIMVLVDARGLAGIAVDTTSAEPAREPGLSSVCSTSC